MSSNNTPVVEASISTSVSDSSERCAVGSMRLSQYVCPNTVSRQYQVSSSEDSDFNENIKQAVEALNAGVNPILIEDGSSGSYFIRDVKGKMLAIFKPKDEEPFAPLNPKWPKFFQKILCFCCFGRACLIPNHGYLSETGASLVDYRLNLGIVPKTRVVKLCSPTFFYGHHCGKPVEPRPKEGSYQIFVSDYKSATDVLNQWNEVGLNNALSLAEVNQFTILFQKMCILDYIIRNTDRHMDNWLIRHIPNRELKIAAIDNGLAFPIKHPESASLFRQFPFNWSTLSWAQKPWEESLRRTLLSTLTPVFVDNMCKELMVLFRHDKSHSRLLTYSQMRVVRGQFWNLRESLIAKESPYALVKRVPLLVTRKYRGSPTSLDWDQCFRAKTDDDTNRGCC